MNPHVDFKTRYLARIGDAFIHESLTCLTHNKKWAWRPTTEQLAKAKRRNELAAQAKPVRILQNVKLQTNGVAR